MNDDEPDKQWDIKAALAALERLELIDAQGAWDRAARRVLAGQVRVALQNARAAVVAGFRAADRQRAELEQALSELHAVRSGALELLREKDAQLEAALLLVPTAVELTPGDWAVDDMWQEVWFDAALPNGCKLLWWSDDVNGIRAEIYCGDGLMPLEGPPPMWAADLYRMHGGELCCPSVPLCDRCGGVGVTRPTR